MGLGKTYSADYLIDSNGNTGVSGQVLISTATGIDWADGSAITGGPFLPLAGGTLTGNLTISNASPALNLTDTDNASNISFSSVGGALIVNSSSDQVYQIAGAEKMRINSSGNVGIGCTPDQKLHVKGTIETQATNSTNGWQLYTYTDNTFRINYNGAGSDELIIDSSGNVGIGTASPNQKLQVGGNLHVYDEEGNTDSSIFLSTGTSDVTTVKIASNGDSFFNAGNVGIGTTAPDAPLHILKAAGGANIVTGLKLDPDDATANSGISIDFNASTTNTGASLVGSRIVGAREGGNASGFLALYTSPDASGSVPLERMRITSGGNVGIGTTDPTSALTIKGTSPYIRLERAGVTTWEIRQNYPATEYGFQIVNVTAGTIPFFVGASNNVGIGTASPSQKLTVVGNTYVSSGLLLLDNNQDIRWGDAGERITGHNTNGLVFTTNNFETMRINSQGKVGIGTTDPGSLLQVGGLDDGSNYDITLGWNAVDSEAVGTKRSAITFKTGQTSVNTEDIYKWDIAMLAAPATVTGEEFGSDLAFLRSTRGSTATDATTMILTRTGNVGIGTTAPDSKLSVTSATLNSEDILYLKSGADNVNDYLGIAWELGVGGNGPHSAIRSFAGPSGSDARLGFLTTTDGGTTLTEGLSVAHNGNVGIGTTSPDQRLHVAGNAKVTGVIYTDYVQTLGGTSIDFRHQDASTVMRVDTANARVGIGTTSPTEKLAVDGNIETAQSSGKIGFNVGDAYGDFPHYGLGKSDGANPVNLAGYYGLTFGTNGSERMRIQSGGNVGIGTTAPGAKLDINGIPWVNPADGVHSGWNFRQGGVFKGWVGYVDSNDVVNLSMDGSIANGINVNASHNVGIGTASPNAKLDVVGNTRLGSGTLHVSTDQTFGTGFTYSFRDAVGILNPNGTSAASATAVMSIGGMSNGYSLVTTGNVGIGTASPTHKLHVNGNMRLTGAFRDSNNATGSAGQVLSSTGSATDWIPLPATPTIYTPKVYNIGSGISINAQGRKLVPDFGTLEIEGNTTIQQVSGSDTDFQVTGENTGIYEVTYAVFYKNTGNQRTPLGTYLTLNGTAVNGSLMVNYLRSDVTGGGNWSSCTNTFYVNVTDASHAMALCARRADSSTAPSGISTVEPTGMAVKSTISFRRIS